MLDDVPLVAFAATTDLQRSHAFYGGVLGLRRVETTPYANVYETHGATLRVTLVGRVAGAPYTVLGWNVGDIHDAAAGLDAAGVAFERYDGLEQDTAGVWRSPGGAQVAWFRDPDGNVLSLTESPGPAARR